MSGPPDASVVHAESRSEPTRWSRYVGMPLFWTLFTIILLAGAALRTRHIDMPPIDFPQDRQASNLMRVDRIMEGAGLFDFQRPWLEVQFLPWLTARTRGVAHLMGIHLWTWARLWNVLFSTVFVGLSAWVGFLAVTPDRASHRRRMGVALLVMAVIAFHPFHVRLSRMMIPEALTLALQAAAVVAFIRACRAPTDRWRWAVFALVYAFGIMAKLPALLWLPPFAAVFLFQVNLRWRTKAIAAGGLVVLLVGVLALIQFNPFTFLADYQDRFREAAAQTKAWMNHTLWWRSYAGRVLLMLTLPGAALAVLGLPSAPALFSLALLTMLVVLYPLNNLNTYNFCHLILPGTVLAVLGAFHFMDFFGERRAHGRLLAFLVLAVLFAVLLPLGPSMNGEDRPRQEILHAVKLIEREVPPEAGLVVSEGATQYNWGVLKYLLEHRGRKSVSISHEHADLSQGYYYSLERFGRRPLEDASRGWVAWASLPGEFGGLLLTRYDRATLAPILDQRFLTMRQSRAKAVGALKATAFHLPTDAFDSEERILATAPGQKLQIGMDWHNPHHRKLASLRFKHTELDMLLAAPIRRGGFSLEQGGILCLPPGSRTTAFYTLELPTYFPEGDYQMFYYPLTRKGWKRTGRSPKRLPFLLRCRRTDTARETSSDQFVRNFRRIYPVRHQCGPTAWHDAWLYRHMYVEGFNYARPAEHLVTLPRRLPPGRYRLALKGEGTLITSMDSPQYLWPKVHVELPGQGCVAKIELADDQPAWHETSFEAEAAFDLLHLKTDIKGAQHGRFPCWMINFRPASFGPEGQQYAILRAIRLTPAEADPESHGP